MVFLVECIFSMILVILHCSLMYSDTVTTEAMVNRNTAVGLCLALSSLSLSFCCVCSRVAM